jgi:hypothetical protein
VSEYWYSLPSRETSGGQPPWRVRLRSSANGTRSPSPHVRIRAPPHATATGRTEIRIASNLVANAVGQAAADGAIYEAIFNQSDPQPRLDRPPRLSEVRRFGSGFFIERAIVPRSERSESLARRRASVVGKRPPVPHLQHVAVTGSSGISRKLAAIVTAGAGAGNR